MSTKAEPNVVPLCDILLVLLIIFMLITPMVQNGIDVKLPETSSDSSQTPSGVIVLTMHSNFKVQILQQPPIELSNLKDMLNNIYASRSEKKIFVRAHVSVPFEKFMQMIDIAKEVGIDTLGVIPEYFEEELE